ncbi:hypothetical protein ScPMuIL_002910 [Solemya velum]
MKFIWLALFIGLAAAAQNGCPREPAEGEVGICASMCVVNAGDTTCSTGQVCCPTACGGSSCITPVPVKTQDSLDASLGLPMRPKPKWLYDRCPKSKPRVFCFVDPCRFATCRRYPNARKESDNCGTCRCRTNGIMKRNIVCWDGVPGVSRL